MAHGQISEPSPACGQAGACGCCALIGQRRATCPPLHLQVRSAPPEPDGWRMRKGRLPRGNPGREERGQGRLRPTQGQDLAPNSGQGGRINQHIQALAPLSQTCSGLPRASEFWVQLLSLWGRGRWDTPHPSLRTPGTDPTCAIPLTGHWPALITGEGMGWPRLVRGLANED